VPRLSPLTIALTAALILVVAVGGGGLWYLFLRSAGPAPVSLATMPPGTTASSDPAPVGSLGAAGSPAAASTGNLSGTWTIDRSIGSFTDFTDSFVGYRVQEQLASIGANTAVGRTPDVTGSVTLGGSTVTAVDISANLTTLQSDNQQRDGQLVNQGIQTGQFPTATFKLTSPIDLGSVPAEGVTINATATGDLTLHGVTKSVQVAVQARLSGGIVTVTGSMTIVFADFGIQGPSSFHVLSVDDHGIMEFQLQLRHG
jgi:polyisoprenoid-binding protein YceI